MNDSKILELEHQGASLQSSIYYPSASPSGQYATVLVFHDAMGLSPFTRARAARLAAMGYLVIAVDMYGDAFYCDKPEDAGPYFAPFHENSQLLQSRLQAWYQTITGLPEVDASRMAAIGYCFGGQCVLELARSAVNIRAVVSFHGILKTENPAKPSSLDCDVAVFNGSEDPWVPETDIIALKEEFANAGARLQFTDFAGVYHGFTNPAFESVERAGIKYDALADRVSWSSMLTLLEHSLMNQD